jgi:hypothetical protein
MPDETVKAMELVEEMRAYRHLDRRYIRTKTSIENGRWDYRLEDILSALARRDAALLEVAKDAHKLACSIRDRSWISDFDARADDIAARIREIVAGEKESGG